MWPIKRPTRRGREQQLSSDEGSQEGLQYARGGSGDSASPPRDRQSNGQETEEDGREDGEQERLGGAGLKNDILSIKIIGGSNTTFDSK